ncbi:MAG: hypothetical protein EXR99_13630 [Gemmataceae bacterium]|nr:hypothetical protein [Gemmataceae bacterium]
MNSRDTLHAPTGEGEILRLPARENELIQRNRELFPQARTALFGIPLQELRARCKKETLALAGRFHQENGEEVSFDPASPILASGHQPELFHPGVWLKNFELNRLAKTHGLTPLNLIIDNDQARRDTILVPQARGKEIKVVPASFAPKPSGMTWEDWELKAPDAVEIFSREVLQAFPQGLSTPLLQEFCPLVARLLTNQPNLGLAFSKARREMEKQWGCVNLELPLHSLCQTETFALFTLDLLSRAESFARVHNPLLHTFRKEFGIRSRSHPVPELSSGDDWHEAPFWILAPGICQRQRLTVRKTVQGILIKARGQGEAVALDLRNPLESWKNLSAIGWRIRPRALTTTLFLRLFLAETFLHGIGGAKYDRFTNHIIQDFYQVAPPGYFTISGTLRLFPKEAPDNSNQSAGLEKRLRDWKWNPQRHEGNPAKEFTQLASKRRELISQPGISNKDRFHQLRANLARFQPLQGEAIGKMELDLEKAREREKLQRQLGSREFSFVLFTAESVRQFLIRS